MIQIESLRGAVRFLRNQNAVLKSQELFKELNQLPAYDSAVSGDQPERTRRLHTESTALLREVASFSSTSRVVDLSGTQLGKSWQPTERKPAAQLALKRANLERLKAKVDKLVEEKQDLAPRLRMSTMVKLSLSGSA